ISSEIKQNALSEIFSNVDPVTKSLFRLLFENKRLDILESVATGYTRQYEEMTGVETAVVTTAVPLDDEMESKIRTKIKSLSDKKVVIENIVDPEIIGGFILRIGDQQYNASVANKLRMLKRELAN